MKWKIPVVLLVFFVGAFSIWPENRSHGEATLSGTDVIRGGDLSVEAFSNGDYALRSERLPGEVLHSEVEADIAGSTLKSPLYPHYLTSIVLFHDELGAGHMLTVMHTGLRGMPDLVCHFRVYDDNAWGHVQVSVYNSTSKPIRSTLNKLSG